ncbi:MAG: putative monooxygenase [uncultured Thermomicrobiales bacterium]|uniref:Putative monooxygenase n=1 Tax=uncultured Thermomicrobiales bacterium TaxID=1645740 RepID=A0A6J4U8S7_9BACT|nr:MAG: putative monooxygenase [uncultured Thermomicrobiales bacterium]
MRYGVCVPNFGEYFQPHILAELAYEAEEAGWDGFFVWDHMLFVNDLHLDVVDPWVALTAIAMRTSQIRLGPLVTAVARRRPWKLARETASLDHLSGGRLILGVGLGHPPEDEFAQFGEDPDAKVRAKKLDEGLDVLVGLWSGEPFNYQGEYYQIHSTTFRPRPIQLPRIPVWVAGYLPHKAPFRRAARWDGVCPGGWWDDTPMTPDDLRALLGEIRGFRTSDGPFDVTYSGVTPGNDRSRASAIVAPWAAAGITWWIEGFSPQRGTLVETRARVRQGPPSQGAV